MKILKNRKFVLNLLLVVLAIVPFFILIGSLMKMEHVDNFYINFYQFLEKDTTFAANFVYLLIIFINFALLLVVFILYFKKDIKPIITLVLLAIAAGCNVGIICFSFFLGEINSIQQFVTIVPMMIVMVNFVSLLFIGIRLFIELKKEK